MLRRTSASAPSTIRTDAKKCRRAVKEQIKQFITWIGGAVAGLSILFYAAGYLVYRAHVSMLGLNGVIDYPQEHLLYEGAKFYFTVGAYLLHSFFVLGLASLIALIFLMVLRQLGGSTVRCAPPPAGCALGAIAGTSIIRRCCASCCRPSSARSLCSTRNVFLIRCRISTAA
jgi:hypothetical protein